MASALRAVSAEGIALSFHRSSDDGSNQEPPFSADVEETAAAGTRVCFIEVIFLDFVRAVSRRHYAQFSSNLVQLFDQEYVWLSRARTDVRHGCALEVTSESLPASAETSSLLDINSPEFRIVSIIF